MSSASDLSLTPRPARQPSIKPHYAGRLANQVAQSREIGLTDEQIGRRLRAGWDVNAAMTRPYTDNEARLVDFTWPSALSNPVTVARAARLASVGPREFADVIRSQLWAHDHDPDTSAIWIPSAYLVKWLEETAGLTPQGTGANTYDVSDRIASLSDAGIPEMRTAWLKFGRCWIWRGPAISPGLAVLELGTTGGAVEALRDVYPPTPRPVIRLWPPANY